MQDVKSPNGVDQMVGAMVRVARKEMKMSQEELGKQLGLTFQQVQKYEKGVNRISAGRLFEFARILSKPIDYFYADTFADLQQDSALAGDSPDTVYLLQSLGVADYSRLIKSMSAIRDPHVIETTLDLIDQMADLDQGLRKS